MKILITLFEKNNVVKLLKDADGIIIGNHQFGARLTQTFSDLEIVEIVQQVNNLKKEVFIQANQMFTDKDLEQFKTFLQSLPLVHIDGIIVADIGAVMVLDELGYAHLAVYNPETLHTNYFDFNYLNGYGIKGAYAAKEITLQDIKIIGNEKKHNLFMVGHGHLNMFYSKRNLIKNYTEFTNINNDYSEKQTLKIKEKTRKDQAYPLFSDAAGTHVFRSRVFQTLTYLEALEDVVDYLVIDTMFKDDAYGLTLLALYKNRRYDEKIINDIQEKYAETWDDGFLNFKTFYKKGDN